MPVRRRSCFLLQKRDVALAQALSRSPMDGWKINRETIGIDSPRNIRLGQYKQKSRNCHETFATATGICMARFVARAANSARVTLGLFLCFANAGFESATAKSACSSSIRSGGDKPNGIFARTKHAAVPCGKQVDDGIAQIRGFFLGALIRTISMPIIRPRAANVADDFKLVRPIGQAAEKVFAHAAGIFEILAFDQLRRRQSRRDADWISAERRAVRARLPVHYAGWREHRSERHAAGDAFGDADNVRFDSGVLLAHHFPVRPMPD